MAKKKKLSRRIDDHFYDHPIQKAALENGSTFLIIALSAFIFAFGFRTFIAPSNAASLSSSQGLRLVTGGVSGLGQTFIAIADLLSGHAVTSGGYYDIIYSLLYFGINIPVFILAWKGIGKRFAIYTLINVGLASLFSSLLRYADEPVIHSVAAFVDSNGGLATRALLGGICTGISSAIAFRANASAGGIDVIAYYIALKKNRMVGKYSVYLNFVTVIVYTLVSITDAGWGTEQAAHVFVATLMSVLYLFVTMFVIDSINLRNKKYKVEVVTEMKDLGKILMGNLPHGATMMLGKGAYSERDKYIFEMVVSSYEVKHTIEVIKEADASAFIQVTELKHVYGRFFLPPLK